MTCSKQIRWRGFQAVLDNALKELFDAYDVDQCGYISKDIWFKIEMALAFDRGDECQRNAESVWTRQEAYDA